MPISLNCIIQLKHKILKFQKIMIYTRNPLLNFFKNKGRLCEVLIGNTFIVDMMIREAGILFPFFFPRKYKRQTLYFVGMSGTPIVSSTHMVRTC